MKYFSLCFFFLASLAATQSIHIDLRHTEPNGVGFDQGYTTLEAYLMPGDNRKAYAFLDFRTHVFNNGKVAFNTGVGARAFSDERIWGGNLYYDFRAAKRQNFNQLAIGFESMGCTWDFYANGYLVVGRKNGPSYDVQFDRFQGHEMLLKEKVLSSMSGADATVRVHFLKKPGWDLYFDAGPYYYHGSIGGSLFGGKAALSAKLYDRFFVEGTTSYDHVFKWIGQGIFGFSLPLGPKVTAKKGQKCGPVLSDRLIQFPNHNEIIVLKKEKRVLPAIDPATGEPYFFLFVNNTHPFSDGSYEDPFGTLAQASAASNPGNIIYVFEGDGTSTNMSAGIALLSNQQLLGSGIAQNMITTQGLISIPQMTSGYPVISNTAGDAVTLANNNTISGLHIDQPFGEGVVGTGIANAVIQNNIFTDINTEATSDQAGIDLEGPGMSGTYLISGNIISGTTTRTIGIYLQPDAADVCSIDLISNQITVPKDGVELLSFATTNVTLSAKSNVIAITTAERGFLLQPEAQSHVQYEFSSNTISSPSDNGLYILGRDQSVCSGTVSNCSFINCQNGLRFESGGNIVTMSIDASSNTFAGNSTSDFLARIPNSHVGNLCVSLSKNNAPNLGYEFSNDNASSTLNLTEFIDNIGSINDTGTFPITQNPTCP